MAARSIKSSCLFYIWSALIAVDLYGQDCTINFTLTVSGATAPAAGLDNRRQGCNSWQISYANNGFSAITLAIQEAPDSSGTPGTWGTLTGTAVFGVNPNTNTTGASALIQSYGTNFAPWVRVALTSATGSGSVVGALFGYRAAGTAGTSSSSSSSTLNSGQIADVLSSMPKVQLQWSPAALNDMACTSVTIPLVGAQIDNTTLAAQWPSGLQAGLIGMVRVSATNFVEFRLCNFSGSSVTPVANAVYSATLIN